jgi:hypothetical protein
VLPMHGVEDSIYPIPCRQADRSPRASKAESPRNGSLLRLHGPKTQIRPCLNSGSYLLLRVAKLDEWYPAMGASLPLFFPVDREVDIWDVAVRKRTDD